MDRLRSLRYFMAAAQTGSFSGAAPQLDVSVAAVSKLVSALERELGVRLFERHSSGLALTANGSGYLEACRPALSLLAAADEQVGSAAAARARGTVVVGVQPLIAQQCLTAALPRFNALNPEIQLDIRAPREFTEEAIRRFDVCIFLGWPQISGDLVHRRIGAASYVVCAAPSYWAAHGMPQHPSELARHHCLAIRSQAGTLMDLWGFKRGDELVSVAVEGWLLADNVHRDMLLDTALAGGGVVRVLDWHRRQGFELASGSLVPALVDWEVTEVPPVNLFYPPNVRRIQRVRVFIDFVVQLFREIELQRALPMPATASPRWAKAKRSRASVTPDPRTRVVSSR